MLFGGRVVLAARLNDPVGPGPIYKLSVSSVEIYCDQAYHL